MCHAKTEIIKLTIQPSSKLEVLSYVRPTMMHSMRQVKIESKPKMCHHQHLLGKKDHDRIKSMEQISIPINEYHVVVLLVMSQV